MSHAIIPYSGYGGQGLQVFTPNRVVTVAPAGSLTLTQTSTTAPVICVRVAEATNYKVNGTGDTATMPVGCTGVADGVTSFSFPNGGIVEIM